MVVFNPFVSICIPTYNNPNSLERCLLSVLSQQYKSYEVIITDDSSGDETCDLIKNKFSQQPNIRYIRNKPALGSPGNWDAAINHAKGEYIKIMHHDDWFCSDLALNYFVEAASKDVTSNSMIFCDGYNVYANGERQPIVRHRTVIELQKRKFSSRSICYFNWIGGPSMTFFPRKFHVTFDSNSRWFVDSIFYYDYLKKNSGAFIYINKRLINVTAGSDLQISQKMPGEEKFLEAAYMFRRCTNLIAEGKSIRFRFYVRELMLKYDISEKFLLKALPEVFNNRSSMPWWYRFKLPYQFFAGLRYVLIRL